MLLLVLTTKMQYLDSDLIIELVSFLGVRDILSLSLVSQDTNKVINSDYTIRLISTRYKLFTKLTLSMMYKINILYLQYDYAPPPRDLATIAGMLNDRNALDNLNIKYGTELIVYFIIGVIKSGRCIELDQELTHDVLFMLYNTAMLVNNVGMLGTLRDRFHVVCGVLDFYTACSNGDLEQVEQHIVLPDLYHKVISKGLMFGVCAQQIKVIELLNQYGVIWNNKIMNHIIANNLMDIIDLIPLQINISWNDMTHEATSLGNIIMVKKFVDRGG